VATCGWPGYKRNNSESSGLYIDPDTVHLHQLTMRKKKTHRPIPDTVMHVTPRLQSNDCATWAIKTLTGRTYAEVQDAVNAVDPKFKGTEGLDWDDMIAVGKKLGVKLVWHGRVDLETDAGLVGVTFPRTKHPDHVVVLMQGPVVINTDGTIWRAEDYFAANGGKPQEMLVIAHE